MSDDVNIGNPLNARHDAETRNAPHVTPIPAQAQADDLFDDTVEHPPAAGERERRPDAPDEPHNP